MTDFKLNHAQCFEICDKRDFECLSFYYFHKNKRELGMILVKIIPNSLFENQKNLRYILLIFNFISFFAALNQTNIKVGIER